MRERKTDYPKIYMESQKTLVYQNNSESILDLKIKYRALVMKATCYWHKNRYVDWEGNIQDNSMRRWYYSHLIFLKMPGTHKWKDSPWKTRVGKPGYTHKEKWSYVSINHTEQKWILN